MYILILAGSLKLIILCYYMSIEKPKQYEKDRIIKERVSQLTLSHYFSRDRERGLKTKPKKRENNIARKLNKKT